MAGNRLLNLIKSLTRSLVELIKDFSLTDNFPMVRFLDIKLTALNGYIDWATSVCFFSIYFLFWKPQ